jgi:hypothetical protein
MIICHSRFHCSIVASRPSSIPEDSSFTVPLFKKLATGLENSLFVLSAGSAYVTVLAQAQSNAIAVKGILTFGAWRPLWSSVVHPQGLWASRLIIFYPHPDDASALETASGSLYHFWASLISAYATAATVT